MNTTAQGAPWGTVFSIFRWVLFIPLGFIGGVMTEYTLKLLLAFSRLVTIGPHDRWDGSLLIYGATGAATVIIADFVAPTESKFPGLITGALAIAIYSACSVINFLLGDTYFGAGALVAAVAAAVTAFQFLPDTSNEY